MNSKRILPFAGLPLLGLLFSSIPVNSQCVRGKVTSDLILSDARPTARLPIPAAFWNHPKPILEVPIARIQNASELPFSIFVYLEWASADPESPHKTLLGNFSVYPSNRTGTYVLRASEGLRPLASSGIPPKQRHAAVLLELKPTSPDSPWKSIQVSIAPLRWRDDSSARE